jgi:hypothetical protein
MSCLTCHAEEGWDPFHKGTFPGFKSMPLWTYLYVLESPIYRQSDHFGYAQRSAIAQRRQFVAADRCLMCMRIEDGKRLGP